MALDERFVPHVHRGGVDGRNPVEDRKKLQSRGLAAMAAHMVAGVSDHDAGQRVTDYFFDDGIDGFAIATDSSTPVLHLVQAKWSPDGRHTFKVEEAKKLVAGFAKLREGQLAPGNLLNQHRGEIDPVMSTPGARVCLVFATSGYRSVSPNTRKEIDDDVTRNIGTEISVDVRYLLLGDFVKYLEASVAQRGVAVSAPLLRERPVDERYPALQGTISAAELGQWYLDHGRAIFDDNVRVEMKSDVNDEIVDCLLREPGNFWYFNNGVTALCERWRRAPKNGGEVPYEFTNLRIVNGAQTVSSIGRTMLDNRDSVAKAQVPIRFIALDTEGPRFGARIAYATNRANPMIPRDFLAMDHVQQRLRDDFVLTWRRAYAIRANDSLPSGDAGCSVLEATVAMACGRHDVATLVDAKYNVSSLWKTQGENYRTLFNDRTSVVEVWRRVLALRMIRKALHQDDMLASQRLKNVAVLGELIIAHIVFRQLGDEGIADIQSDWSGLLSSIQKHTITAVRILAASVDQELLSKVASKNPWRDVASLLGNKKWLSDLLDHADLPVPNGQPEANLPWPSEPEFRLLIRDQDRAVGRICDGGFLVRAGALATVIDQSSLSTTQLRHRQNLRDSLGFVEDGGFLCLTRDASFESPSQAAAVLLGHSVNGAGGWTTKDGKTYGEIAKAGKA